MESTTFRIRRTLNVLFPPFIQVLIFFPALVGSLLNHHLIDLREILILLAWLPVLTIPYYLSGKKIFYYLAATLLFLNGFADLAHWLLVKAPLSASGIFVLLNTNAEEAKGFYDLKKDFKLLLLVPYILLFIISLRRPPQIKKDRQGWIVLSVVFLFSLGFIFENAFNGRLLRKGVPVFVKAPISFFQEVRSYRLLKSQIRSSNRLPDVASPYPDVPQVCVLLIGESANRNHLGIYGYSRPTSPFLERNKELIVFDNVVSAFAHTLSSVPASLTSSNLENNLRPVESISLIEVFKAAGFKTFWISNQAPLGIWENLITLFAEQSEVVEFVNVSSSSSMESNSRASFDENVFEPFQRSLNDPASKKLIIVHLMGSHSAYDKRYPARFAKFADKSSRKSALISAYDNSILYTDFVVDSLIRQTATAAETNKTASALIYFSDHGENVYDDGDNVGHDYTGSMPKSLVEIPFVVWHSKKYAAIFSQQASQIHRSTGKPFVTDDLFHTALDLFGLETSVLEKNRSFFNPQFNDKRKRILEDGLDYDQK